MTQNFQNQALPPLGLTIVIGWMSQKSWMSQSQLLVQEGEGLDFENFESLDNSTLQS